MSALGEKRTLNPRFQRTPMSDETSEYPPLWRVALGFLLAPYLGFWAFMALSALLEGKGLGLDFPFSLSDPFLIFAYAPALLLGVPAYLLLRSRVNASAINCASTGATVAIAGMLLILLPTPPRSGLSWDLIVPFAAFAACGAFGGCVFWMVVAMRLKRASPSS
jgi:hypothetical protein